MKILKGLYKGVEIVSPDDPSVRPTVDHLKKHIMRIYSDFAGTQKKLIVWDLFCGSGGVGLEILSSGAMEVTFVDQLNKSLACLRLNTGECQIKNSKAFETQNVTVISAAVENFLKDPKKFGVRQTPDFIFLDPPYGQGWMKKVMPLLLNCSLINKNTQILAEHVTDDPIVEENNIKVINQEIYGPKVLTIVKIKPAP